MNKHYNPKNSDNQFPCNFKTARRERLQKNLITVLALGVTALGLCSCESSEEKAKRMACEALAELNISASQYDENLIREIMSDNAERINLLITAGADVNTRYNGEPALMVAVKRGNQEVVKLLVDAGADVHAKDDSGKTAFHVAAEEGNSEAVNLLLERGIDVNILSSSGATAICYAASNRRSKIVGQLIEAGAATDVLDTNGNTLLMYGVKGGDHGTMTMILDKGVDVNAVNKAGYSALHLAVEAWNADSVKSLLSANADTSLISPEGLPIIAIAAKSGNEEIIKLLINAGVDPTATFKYDGELVNAQDFAYWTHGRPSLALEEVSCYKTMSIDEAIKMLKKADILYSDFTDSRCKYLHWTSVSHIKSHSGNILHASKLYNEGKIELSDYEVLKEIYYLWAFHEGKKDFPGSVFAAFLAEGANGSKALTPAVYFNHLHIVKLLLASPGIDVNAVGYPNNREQDRRYPDEYARESTPLFAAATTGNTEIVKLLLAAPGIDVNSKAGYYKESALWVAARNAEIEIIKLLLAAPGIDVNCRALHTAIERGHADVVKLLLATPGIDVNCGALHTAVESSCSNTIEIIKLLLEAPGIDVNAKNYRGKTPRDLATEKGYAKIVKLLESAGAN